MLDRSCCTNIRLGQRPVTGWAAFRFSHCTQPCPPVMVPLNIRSSVTACNACQLVFRPQQALASAPSTSCSWSSQPVRPARCCKVWHQLARHRIQHPGIYQSWCSERACAQGRLGASLPCIPSPGGAAAMAEAQQCAISWHPTRRWSAKGLPTSADKQPHKVEQGMHFAPPCYLPPSRHSCRTAHPSSMTTLACRCRQHVHK